MNNNEQEDFVDAEVLYADLRPDFLPNILWRTKTGERIRIGDMEDKHLRNCVLFLTDFGYTKCVATVHVRLMWLKVFKMEWQRRLAARKSGIKKTVRHDTDEFVDDKIEANEKLRSLLSR